MENKSHETIKDKISSLDWNQMQDLVAGLLRAMGYKTQFSPQSNKAYFLGEQTSPHFQPHKPSIPAYI